MIKVFTSSDEAKYPEIFRQMFEARAAIFSDRLGWEVGIDNGQERDRYDELEHATYIVVIDENGDANASLRLLPTTGDTMMKNEFSGFFSEPVDVVSPTIVECTRFCVHPALPGAPNEDPRQRSSELSIGLYEVCERSGFEFVLGLYNARMDQVYRRIGWAPEMLTESISSRGHLRVGLWEVTPEALVNMKRVRSRYERIIERRAAA